MSSKSCQFKGIDSVSLAYRNRDVPAWSLWESKQMLFKFEGTDLDEGEALLHEIMTALADNGTNAIYTLKSYEELQDGKIKNNTPDDGSFNFRINSDTQEITQGQYGSVRINQKIEERLAAIEEKMGQEPEEKENKLGFIGELMENETIAPILQSLLTGVLTKIFAKPGTPAQLTPPQPAIPAGIDQGTQGIAGIETDQLTHSIQLLQRADPDLPAHLAKLAELAQTKPDTFNLLTSSINSL
jgi:hypothetical protein